MRNFRDDLATGKRWESELAEMLPGATATSKPERHLGDLKYNGVYLEAKLDERGITTGNLYLELLDWTNEAMLITGVAKHATQEGERLIVHRIGDTVYLYDPRTALGVLHNLVHTKRGRWVTQRNGWGETGGIVVPVKHLEDSTTFQQHPLGHTGDAISAWRHAPKSAVAEADVCGYLRYLVDPTKIPYFRDMRVKQ